MAEDMAATAQEMFEAAGIRDPRVEPRRAGTAGWSIHELGTARMGTDPKTSVLNQFQQSHDVKNLFVVDGASHRQRRLPESDLDHHGAVLAFLRLPGQ